MKKFFIGIDFSKLFFDASIYSSQTKTFVCHSQFENAEDGFNAFISWVNLSTKCDQSALLFCGEYTGYYSYNLPIVLYEGGYQMWLASGLEIKLSLGIKREKTDHLDAQSIAQYAYRFNDKFRAFQPVPAAIVEIKDLLCYRNRLVEIRKMLSVSSKELHKVRETESSEYIYQESNKQIANFNTVIKECESKIESIIGQDPVLNKNYELMTSIKGIGLVNAVLIIVATANFTQFSSPRKFGCYIGVVPFKHKSGTSVRGKTRVSKLANKTIKANITLAARNSIRYDPEIREYYQRKISEGKNDWLVLNNVKNKLIHRIFAVVNSGEMYNQNYSHPLKKRAA